MRPKRYQGLVCKNGHDDGTGHSVRYSCSGNCVECHREWKLDHRAPYESRIKDDTHGVSPGGRPILFGSPLESKAARSDVIAHLYRRDGESWRFISRIFRIGRDAIHAAVFTRCDIPRTVRSISAVNDRRGRRPW